MKGRASAYLTRHSAGPLSDSATLHSLSHEPIQGEDDSTLAGRRRGHLEIGLKPYHHTSIPLFYLQLAEYLVAVVHTLEYR